MTPCQRKWVYHVYQPLSFFTFGVLIGLGLYIMYAGKVGGELLQDYCDNNFERWTKIKYGNYAVALDRV